MANDITSINSAKSQQSATRSAQRVKDEADHSGSTASSGQTSSDKVSLTSTASRLKDIERSLGNEAPVNTDRVNQVRSAIARGEYNVDASRVADKMMDFETSLHN